MPKVNISELIKDDAHPATAELMSACLVVASVNEARDVARAAGVTNAAAASPSSLNVASAIEQARGSSIA